MHTISGGLFNGRDDSVRISTRLSDRAQTDVKTIRLSGGSKEMSKLNEWYEWSQKTLKVLGVIFIAMLIAVEIFGVTISVPVSYEMVEDALRAEIMDPVGSDGPRKVAKK